MGSAFGEALFWGEVIRERGRAVGCRLVDRHGAVSRHGLGRGEVLTAVRTSVGLEVTARAADGTDGHPLPCNALFALLDGLSRIVNREPGRGLHDQVRESLVALWPARPMEHVLDSVMRQVQGNAHEVLAAVSPFCWTLDQDAFGVMTSKGMPELGEQDYGALDVTIDAEAPLARALRAMPLLRRAAVEAQRTRPDALRSALTGRGGPDLAAVLRSTIDAGNGDLPRTGACVTEIMRDDAAMVRDRLLTGLPERDPDEALDDTVRLGRMLACLPSAWVPRDATSWAHLTTCLPALTLAVRRAAPRHVPAMLNAMGDWEGFARRLSAAAGDGANPPHRVVRRAVSDVADVVKAFARQLVSPALGLSTGTEAHVADLEVASFDLLFAGRTVIRILEVSRAWHGRSDAIRAALPGMVDATPSWRAGLPDAEHAGVSIHVLTDAASLAAEGAHGPDARGLTGLGHCVGAYAPDCLSGRSRILSVREAGPRGARLSTAQVVRRPEGGFQVAQHRGRLNGDPPQRARDALRWYMSGVSDGSLPVDRTALVPFVDRDVAPHLTGYDWRVPGHWEAVRDLWAPHLPRRLRSATPDDVRREVEASRSRSHAWLPPTMA